MAVDGRLSDTLNRREPIDITEVQWAPLDGSEPFSEAPGLKAIDPYDLILVLAGETSLPAMSTDEAAAHRIHKVAYDLLLEAPPYRIIGTVNLYPGTDPHASAGSLERDVRAGRARAGDDGRAGRSGPTRT